MKFKRRRKANKQILLTQLFLTLLLFIGIGYSILNTNLGIDGTVQLNKYAVPTLKIQNDNTNITFGKTINRNSFKSITIVDHINIPNDAIDSWDASEESNGKVMAWYVQGENNDKHLYIGAKNGVYLNPESSYAFSYFTNVEEINIEKLNSSLATTFFGLFGECSNLKRIDVINLDSSKVTDMTGMFYKCHSLSSITGLENLNTDKVASMVSMFEGCSSLTTLDVSKWNTGKVTNMIYMFNGCSSLTTLDVSNWDTSNVTSMINMFVDCGSLTSLNVSSWDTSKVTNMGAMFARCSKLTNLDVSKWNTSSVTDMNHMFVDCSSLTSLNVSSWDTSKVTNMEAMFARCSNLETIYASNLWNVNAVVNSGNMFLECKKIVGGKGTTYNPAYINKSYAKIDGGTSNPGYLTN